MDRDEEQKRFEGLSKLTKEEGVYRPSLLKETIPFEEGKGYYFIPPSNLSDGQKRLLLNFIDEESKRLRAAGGILEDLDKTIILKYPFEKIN